MLKQVVIVTTIFHLLITTTLGEVAKRQVGMLARSGELPNLGGKRSVGALARNGELPGKRDPWGMDERQRLRLLSEWLREMDDAVKLEEALQHEVAKRNMEAMARAGYLVKPATDAPEPSSSLLDSEEFLGKIDFDNYGENEDGFPSATDKRGGIATLARLGYIGKRDDISSENDELLAEDYFLSPAEKRHLASVKSFISRFAKRNLGAFKSFGYAKRHIGAARNFALVPKRNQNDEYEEKRNVGSARRFTGKRNVGAARNFLFHEMKKNLGAARQFFSGSKKNLGAARSFYYGKRNLASLARDGGFPNSKHVENEDEYPWNDEDHFDFDDFHDDDKRHLASFIKSQSGKRYLGSLRAGKRTSEPSMNVALSELELPLASVLSDVNYDDDHDFLGNEQDDSSTISKRETKDGQAGQGHGHATASRRKRSAEYAFSPNELSMDLHDYNDYEDAIYPNGYEKRFLGESDTWAVSKRHIGALARMGLLPSFRSSRYSRSGRAISNRIVPFRENSSIRSCPSSKDSTASWSKTPSAASQLAIRRSVSSPIGNEIATYAPFGSRARHPMAFHKSFYI